MHTCDRQTLMNLALGTLMHRDAQGRVVIGDTEEAHAAMKAHDRGEWVRLRSSKGIYTYLYRGTEMTAYQYKRHRKAGMK